MIACIKWENFYRPKYEGGLGIKDISTFNNVLLAKGRGDLRLNPQDNGEIF